MKKFISLLFAMLLSMTNLVMAQWREVIYEEDLPIRYWVNIDDKFAKAISYQEDVDQYPREDLYFRDEVEYNGNLYPVTLITNDFLSLNYSSFSGIKTIRLPKRLQIIRDDPFRSCGSLDELFIPSEVKEIDKRAFNNCRIKWVFNSSRALTNTEFINECSRPYPRLIDVDTICVGDGFKYYIYGDIKCIYQMDEATHIDIPEGYHYDRALFKDCKKLESVTLPAGLDSIPMEFFSGCERLKEVNGLEHIRTIGKKAFYGCHALEEVNLGESLAEIGEEAFCDCSLKEIVLPKSIKTLGRLALAENDFEECILPESITYMGIGVFDSCEKLTSIIIPENFTAIPDGTFVYCNLKNISLPQNIAYIGNKAFAGCRSLNSIVLPESVKELGDSAFFECESLCLLKCEAIVPPKANNSTFGYVPYYIGYVYGYIACVPFYKCEVRVPEESVEDYRNADGWWNFRLWNEEWTGAIEEISLDEAAPSPAFDLMGRPTGSNDKGIRILRQGNTTRKVLIK